MTIEIKALFRAAARFGVILGVGLALPAFAEEDANEDVAEGPNTGRFSFAFQNDLTNVYFFRGLLQERDGYIWQPELELYLNLFESEDFPIRSVTIGGGVWNSFHENDTLAARGFEGDPAVPDHLAHAHGPQALYETDWYPMLEVGLPYDVTFTGIYYYYTSPNGAFETVQEANLGLAWDDSGVFGRFALQPWINFALETDRTSFGDRRGELFQLGIEPTLFKCDDETFPLKLTLPVELGLAIDDYYEEVITDDVGDIVDRDEDTFGYLTYGLTASLPLNLIPAEWGTWTASIAGKGYYLHNALERLNRGDGQYAQVVGSLLLEY